MEIVMRQVDDGSWTFEIRQGGYTYLGTAPSVAAAWASIQDCVVDKYGPIFFRGEN